MENEESSGRGGVVSGQGKSSLGERQVFQVTPGGDLENVTGEHPTLPTEPKPVSAEGTEEKAEQPSEQPPVSTDPDPTRIYSHGETPSASSVSPEEDSSSLVSKLRRLLRRH